MIWSTPQPIFDKLNRRFKFVVDLCADAGNAKCKLWLPRETSLAANWSGIGTAWLNPPYGRDISEWVKKASLTPRTIVGFLPGRTNAPWFHDYVMRASELWFVRRKVSFANGEGCKGVPPWGAIVAVWESHGYAIQSPPLVLSWDWKTA